MSQMKLKMRIMCLRGIRPTYDQLRAGSEIDFTGEMRAVMQNTDPARLGALLDSTQNDRSKSTPIRGPN